MELVEEIVITYLGGGWGDHHHQGRFGRLLAIGVGKRRLVFVQGFPCINHIPPLFGTELGIEALAKTSYLWK